jgi:CHAT domain-containing protein/tetratricopeptide (TPR) repeat protein
MLRACARKTVALITLAVAMAASAVAARSPLDEALALEQQGKLKEARNLYHAAAEEFRASGDQRQLAAALSSAGNVSVALGDYAGVIADVEQAIKLRQSLHDTSRLGADFNNMGRAYQYLGNYPAALENYQEALKLDRMQRDAAGEVTRLNNIGGIHFYQGRYVEELESYQAALVIVNANKDQPWNPWGRKLTSSNIATVYQRLGLEERALEIYQETSGKPEEMPPNEYAQRLLNEGVLYRRLGDPVKALELYRDSQAVYRTARYSDGEINALRNIGIAKAMDLGDLQGARQAFTAALELAQQSSNSRGMVQANLYLGEVLRRLKKYKEASEHLNAALAAAEKAGLVEDQWKTLFSLGRTNEETGDLPAALDDYRKAISVIESVRSGLRTPLRIDFLADKRDVYDSLIALELRQSSPSASELLEWMERSRARTLLDRMAARTPLSEFNLRLVQSRLSPDTVLAEFWVSKQDSAAVWITAADSGIVKYASADDMRAGAEKLLAAIQAPGDGWKNSSREVGAKILAGMPLRRHLIVVPDGPLNLPFEALGVPGSETLLIERCDITYLPSARFVALPEKPARSWLFPWTRQLVAIGDPPVASSDALAAKEQWQSLPASADEVRGIAKIIPGRAEIHLGADARKAYLLDRRIEGLPLLHLSTHALVDTEHPDRSRILMASDSPGSADYLFQGEVNDLDLKNVGLVTVSACDTARGKIVAGEGVQAFSQSFLAAGASATITSLWRVADQPTASFMSHLYYSLGRGVPKAEALRAAKLDFLRSNSALSSPRYWAAFVLNGDGWSPATRVVPWSAILLALAAVLAVTPLIFWLVLNFRAARRERRTAPPSR